MASSTIDNYSSDADLICEEQIQYTYLDEEIAPMGGIVNEENEDRDFGIIDIEEYERVRDQAEDLDARNWELKVKCKAYEQELRILRRSILVRIRDKTCYWKKVATTLKQRTKTWIKRTCQQSTEDTLTYPTSLRYRDMLEARYYPHDLNLE